jgi:hypothetical protein
MGCVTIWATPFDGLAPGCEYYSLIVKAEVGTIIYFIPSGSIRKHHYFCLI